MIPTNQQYQDTLTRLIEQKKHTIAVAIRLGCELGMTRIEICNTKKTDLDRIHQRGLWVETAKRVRRGHKKTGNKKTPVFKMRQRELPINKDLYQILSMYSENSNIYLLQKQAGKQDTPMEISTLNHMYHRNQIPWTTHESRHYFKTRVWSWMMKNQQPDPGLMKELMGHQKTVHENYGEYSWDYKLEIIDRVFQ